MGSSASRKSSRISTRLTEYHRCCRALRAHGLLTHQPLSIQPTKGYRSGASVPCGLPVSSRLPLGRVLSSLDRERDHGVILSLV